MKVTEKNVGGPSGRLDVKSTKGEGAKGLDSKNSVGAQAVENSSGINISERAQMMKKAKEIASQQTVDDAKVARLQKLIDEGKYKVDASKIADRLVDEHLATES